MIGCQRLLAVLWELVSRFSILSVFWKLYSIHLTLTRKDLTGLDGTNQWPQISTAQNTTRTSFIYNINPYGQGGPPYIVIFNNLFMTFFRHMVRVESYL